MNIIFIGALIAIAGGLLTAWGTLQQNKASSKRIQNIQSTGESINTKSEKQLKEIINLKTQNSLLKSTVDSLNSKANEQQEKIIELSNKNSELSLQLARSTETLYGSLTGGSSFCELIIQPIGPNVAEMTLVSHGDFPLYELSLRIVDLDLFGQTKIKTFDDFAKTQVILNVGNMQPHSAKIIGQLTSDFSKEYKAFNVFFNARNGFFTQGTRLFKINNSWKGATEISGLNKNNLLYKKNDPAISKDLLKSN